MTEQKEGPGLATIKDIVLYIIVIHVYFFKAHLKLTIMH